MPRLSAEAERFDPGPALDDIAIDRSHSIAPQIYDALRARIVDNRLPPGGNCALLRHLTNASARCLAAAGQRRADHRPSAGRLGRRTA